MRARSSANAGSDSDVIVTAMRPSPSESRLTVSRRRSANAVLNVGVDIDAAAGEAIDDPIATVVSPRVKILVDDIGVFHLSIAPNPSSIGCDRFCFIR